MVSAESKQRISDRTFGFAMGAVFGAIAGVAWFGFGVRVVWAAAVSAALLVPAVSFPGLLMPLNRLWSALGHRVGLASNAVLLGAFYYLVIVPFGLTARAFGSRSILKRPIPSRSSYWVPVQRQAGPETYPDLF